MIAAMTPKDFHNLDDHEQAELVWNGEFKGSRQDGEHTISRYRVTTDLYVDVYIHNIYNIVRKMEAMSG